MDEGTDHAVSALDHAARWQVLALIERVVTDLRVPTLYVSHNQSEVLRLCRTAARLEDGRVVAVGPADEVLADAAPRAGEAVWNIIRVEADAEGVPCLAGGARLVIAHELTPGESAWCRISSASIALRPSSPASSATTPTGARNHVPARVLTIATLGDRERVTVDAGVALQIDVTPQARAELDLAPGRDVVCTFKTYAVELLYRAR
jgi:molybdate transport system ATP-binding protein